MTQYLYIDDERDGAESFADALVEANGTLRITVVDPEPLDQIVQLASKNADGILLDVKLSNTKDNEGKLLLFDGIGLAQQLRSLQTRGKLVSLPIVRLSQPQVIDEYVRGDPTSDDCFDERISKDEIINKAVDLNRQLLSLAVSYPQLVKYLQGAKDQDAIASLFAVPADFLDRLDSRLLAEIQQAENLPAHVLARFFLDKLLARPGPLVSEDLLAVRLGIDQSKSKGWAQVIKNLEEARYFGPFFEGYPRWWMAIVSDIWDRVSEKTMPLARMPASKRVELLSKAWRTDLQHIEEVKESPGTRYWSICIETRRPVDPAHGVALLPARGHQPWHDAEYFSLETALRDNRNARIRPDDKARLQRQLKQQSKPQA